MRKVNREERHLSSIRQSNRWHEWTDIALSVAGGFFALALAIAAVAEVWPFSL